MGFETFCLNYGNSHFLTEIWKSATAQNVPKPFDNYQEQLVLGLGYQFKSFKPRKWPKKKFQDLEFVNVNNNNAIETPFFTNSSPLKDMMGILIGL